MRTLPLKRSDHYPAERGPAPDRARTPASSVQPRQSQRRSGEPGLFDRIREAIRTHHYSPRTERAYVGWARRFIGFHNGRHPAKMGKVEVARFLSSLAVKDKVSASTQNQALAALIFLYSEVLGRDIGWLDDVIRAKAPKKLPVVLTREEVQALMDQLDQPH